MEQKKVALTTLKEMKQQGVPITMVTAYDYPTARLWTRPESTPCWWG